MPKFRSRIWLSFAVLVGLGACDLNPQPVAPFAGSSDEMSKGGKATGPNLGVDPSGGGNPGSGVSGGAPGSGFGGGAGSVNGAGVAGAGGESSGGESSGGEGGHNAGGEGALSGGEGSG